MKKLTKRGTFIGGILIVTFALIMMAVFMSHFRADDDNRHVAVDYLRRTAELQHRLKESVLEAHAFRLETYDPLVKVTNELQSTCSEMQSLDDTFLISYNSKVRDALQNYCDLNDKALSLVEEFKSNNSLLRNSLKYFPVIIENLKSQSHRSFALDLYSDILLYCLQPDARSLVDIQRDLSRIPSLSAAPEDRKQLLAFAAHSRIALQTALLRETLEDEIYSPPLQAAVMHLADTYITATDAVETRSKYFKAAAISFSAMLLLVLLVLLYQLQQTAESLSDLNGNLENKVETRTIQLKKALMDLETQQQLVAHSTKMSALGEMAGGIAHEINTPLAAISLKAESMLLDEVPEATAKSLNEIISIVERVAKIVLGLRKFSRMEQDVPFVRTSVASVIDDTLILCSQKFANYGVAIGVHLEDGVAISCHPEQITQVLLNLLNNAFDAVSDLPEKWVEIEAAVEDGKVVITVTDSGKGIPESVREKLMQPFFTTKGVGKGTGIGLSISRGIIEKHGGALTLDSTTGHTTFKIILPSASDPFAVSA